MSDLEPVPQRCQHEGCQEEAIPCYCDDDLLAEPQRITEYLCCDHASKLGYCPGCGRFWAGVDSFDSHGWCDDCWAEIRADEADDEDWDEWDWEMDDL